jgi:hypothetical protein
MSVVAERRVEALADALEMRDDFPEAAAESVDALGDLPDPALELALVAVERRSLHVDDAPEAADEVDERVEAADRPCEVVAGVAECRRDLRDARFETAQALGQQVAGLGGSGGGHWK